MKVQPIRYECLPVHTLPCLITLCVLCKLHNVYYVKSQKNFSEYCQKLRYCISRLVLYVLQTGMTQLILSSSRENPGVTSSLPTGRVEPERPTGALPKLLSTNESQESLKGVPTLIHTSPSSSSSAVQQANAMLQDLSRLKDEMKNLIQVGVVNIIV